MSDLHDALPNSKSYPLSFSGNPLIDGHFNSDDKMGANSNVQPQNRDSNTISRKVLIAAPSVRRMSCRIRPQESGMEITQFLTSRFPFRSPETWKTRLNAGWITQGVRTLIPGDRLLPDPALGIYHPRFIEPSVPDEVVVLEDKADYLLIYKPAPMPVHPGGRYHRNTLLEILRDQRIRKNISQGERDDPGHFDNRSVQNIANTADSTVSEIQTLHRLDAVTSGLILFGRNPDFSRKIQQALQSQRVQKSYIAKVSGIPEADQATIDDPIRRKEGYLFECSPKGKTAITHVQVLQRYQDSSLVRCQPVTGRTHQIRLHLKEWGHPVIDDPVYGPGMERFSGSGLNASQQAYPMQNIGISLLHERMTIPENDLDFNLHEYSGIFTFPLPFDLTDSIFNS